ncbi:MAG TPA: hypothetical protein VLE97_01965 [Gaiellaceae bacterium]|nr:hypothetical protein [Gaiellaceae bacterium]
MNNVVQLDANPAIAIGNDEIAGKLETLASRIREGEFGDVKTVILVLEPLGRGLRRRVYGERIDQARGTGLLFMAAQRMGNGWDQDEDAD